MTLVIERLVSVSIDKETVWLTQEQMGHLFERERSVITKHIRNVFAEGELARESVCAKFAHTATDYIFLRDFKKLLSNT